MFIVFVAKVVLGDVRNMRISRDSVNHKNDLTRRVFEELSAGIFRSEGGNGLFVCANSGLMSTNTVTLRALLVSAHWLMASAIVFSNIWLSQILLYFLTRK